MGIARVSIGRVSIGCVGIGRVAWALLGGLAMPAAAQEAASLEAGSARLGPSFACPAQRDALGQLICASATLSRRDLEFVQTYQALRQQSRPPQQATLRAEAAEFGRTVRSACAIPAQAGADPPAAAADCVEREYGRQRAAWAARLKGAAEQEARRGLDQQVALQRDLQRIGLLPPEQAIDGVYGASTRVAIAAFQQTMGLVPTGLLGDADALALTRQGVPRQAGGQDGARQDGPRQDGPRQDGPRQDGPRQDGMGQGAPGSAAARSDWDDFQAKAMAAGVTVTVAPSGPCVVTFQVRDPGALAGAAGSRAVPAQGAHKADEAARLFAAEMAFLRTDLAARAVHAFYGVQPAATDRCRFEAAAFTTDLYGRDVVQPLFAFQFDRATYAKVVWNRFESSNMPRIVLAFEYDAYSRQRLRAAGGEGVEMGPPRDDPPAPAASPRRPELTQAAADVPVAHWAGSATMTTRPFHVDGPWEVRWRSDGAFTVLLHPVGSAPATVVAQARDHGASSAYQPQAGDFYLEVDASGPWTVDVVQVAGP